MRRTLLRLLLILDAAALFLIGAIFIAFPARALSLFGIPSETANMHFVIGIFGTVYATMGIGYLFAAQNPMRNIAWVQVAIGRGIAESLFSIFCVVQGIATFRQAGFSMIVPALVAVGCIVLYPRPELPTGDAEAEEPPA